MPEITVREQKWKHLEQAARNVAKWPKWKKELAGICQCTFSRKILGDGCSICNPEMAQEIAEENERDKHLYPNECESCGRPKTNNICGVCGGVKKCTIPNNKACHADNNGICMNAFTCSKPQPE